MPGTFFTVDGPLNVHPVAGQCRAANLAQLARFGQENGRDIRPVLERNGLVARVLCDPDNLIGTRQMVAVLEECSETFEDSLFGLRLAAIQGADVFGCITALCRSAPTLRSGLQCLIDYLPVVHSPDCKILLVEGQDTARLEWTVETDLGANDQANLQAAMLNVQLLRVIGGDNFTPDWISLSVAARNEDAEEIARLLGCRTLLGRARNAIAFSCSALGKSVSTASHVPYRLIRGYLDSLSAVKSNSIADRVEAYVRGALSTGYCSLERCAENISVSVRTLQHHLATEGVLFSELVEREREILSKTYLANGDLSLVEIAQRLGYGDQTSFGRAFKRWTGVTPNDFRRIRSRRY